MTHFKVPRKAKIRGKIVFYDLATQKFNKGYRFIAFRNGNPVHYSQVYPTKHTAYEAGEDYVKNDISMRKKLQ